MSNWLEERRFPIREPSPISQEEQFSQSAIEYTRMYNYATSTIESVPIIYSATTNSNRFIISTDSSNEYR